MADNWSFVWTPQFLVGSLVMGFILNVFGTYVVRWIDSVRAKLPAYYRRVRVEEKQRTQHLVEAATADTALYAALSAEAARLQIREVRRYFVALVSFIPFFILAASEVLTVGKPPVTVARQSG